MANDTFRAGDFTAVIGDNEPYEGHRAGYNGVHCLTHRTNSRSLCIGCRSVTRVVLCGASDLCQIVDFVAVKRLSIESFAWHPHGLVFIRQIGDGGTFHPSWTTASVIWACSL